jgi:rare lipoprotein A
MGRDAGRPAGRGRPRPEGAGTRTLSVLALALALAACASTGARPGPREGAAAVAGSDARPLFEQRGEASWFGGAVEGRPGKSGEGVDPDQMVASHPTLPMDSVVRVTNLANGRSVEVRIVDRGPTAPGRAIDLSRKAARELGMTEKGTVAVRIEAFAADQPSEQVKQDLAALVRR